MAPLPASQAWSLNEQSPPRSGLGPRQQKPVAALTVSQGRSRFLRVGTEEKRLRKAGGGLLYVSSVAETVKGGNGSDVRRPGPASSELESELESCC